MGYTSEQDVKLRSTESSLWRTLSGLLVLVVLISEPFFCDVFFAKIGGHFLFDLTLALDVLTAVVMEGKERRSGGVDYEEEVEEKKKNNKKKKVS